MFRSLLIPIILNYKLDLFIFEISAPKLIMKISVPYLSTQKKNKYPMK